MVKPGAKKRGEGPWEVCGLRVGADRKIAGGPLGITLPGDVPATYTPGARSVECFGQLKWWATVWSVR